jgi:hypothetical protein
MNTETITINDTKTPLQKFQEDVLKKHNATEVYQLDIKSLGPWSASKYKTLVKCPFQFYLKYILKLKVPEGLAPRTDPLSAQIGTAAHRILEYILLGKSVDKAFQLTKKEAINETLTEEIWKERVDTLTYNISKFKEKIDTFDRINPIKRVLTELRVGINDKFESTGFFAEDVWIRGVVDLVLILDCMDVVIIDHKTGGGQGPITPYEEQLDWYKVLFQFGIEKARGIQTAIHFIGEGDVKMAKYSPAPDIESSMKNTLVMSLEGAIEMLKSHGYFKHIRGNLCKYCEFDNIGCKSGDFKEIEKQSKKWIPIKVI